MLVQDRRLAVASPVWRLPAVRGAVGGPGLRQIAAPSCGIRRLVVADLLFRHIARVVDQACGGKGAVEWSAAATTPPPLTAQPIGDSSTADSSTAIEAAAARMPGAAGPEKASSARALLASVLLRCSATGCTVPHRCLA